MGPTKHTPAGCTFPLLMHSKRNDIVQQKQRNKALIVLTRTEISIPKLQPQQKWANGNGQPGSNKKMVTHY